jgi:NAD(P)-dependent dehydrogenase (short-subunit alcohol dehydrogenase family)
MSTSTVQNIVITGVSTGIGHAAAEAFVARGARVFGTVRSAEDAARASATLGDRFVPLIADVTDGDAVQRAARVVGTALGGRALDGLINNAGVAVPGPLAEQPEDQIRKMFEVNVFGLVAMTKACLPLLGMRPEPRATPGRVINISSGAGKLSVPFLAAYTATKHAVEGLSHSLRRELLPWGIPVIVVGPGNVRTPIWAKAGDESAWDHTDYAGVYRNFIRYMLAGEKKGMQPREIAELLVTIMEAPRPKARYAPVAQKLVNWTIPRLLSDEKLDQVMFKALGMQRRARA